MGCAIDHRIAYGARRRRRPLLYSVPRTVEKASNRAIIPGENRSREMVYYGRDASPLASLLTYGAPIKYLVHPEVRDSKFDDHALPGVYRGPSRDDESDYRCWVQAGSGATLRHVTVDTGCVRVDERSIIARTDRNHPSHQPFAIDPTPPSPPPDLTTWFNPVEQSYSEIDIWTVDRPLPTAPTRYCCWGQVRSAKVTRRGG